MADAEGYNSSRTGAQIDQAVGNANNALLSNGRFRWGSYAAASGSNSFAFGYDATAQKTGSVAIGTEAYAVSQNQIVIGPYSYDNSQAIIVFAGGTANNQRKDLGAFYQNGDLHVRGDIYAGANGAAEGGTKIGWTAEDDGDGNVTIT